MGLFRNTKKCLDYRTFCRELSIFFKKYKIKKVNITTNDGLTALCLTSFDMTCDIKKSVYKNKNMYIFINQKPNKFTQLWEGK